MNPLNPLFAVVVMSIAFITGYLLNLKFKSNNSTTRFETIDGLRGFLALAVFIHHSAIWYQYKEEGNWRLPDSNLYIHFGETSVALFFMITSFLFVKKLIDIKENEFNWKQFFISRFLRLAPMYYFSLLLIIILIMISNNWKLNVSLYSFFKSLFDWLTFTITDTPDINNFYFTDKINAGVTWSLPYEWLFYFTLPIIALIVAYKKTKIQYILISIIFITFFCLNHIIELNYIYAFIGGIITAFLSKYVSINTKIKNQISSIIVIICLLLIRQFSSSKNEICMLLISIVFTLIALGTSVFGILRLSVFKFLGDISFSTYLLHGIVLFFSFHFIISMENLKLYSASEFCLVIFTITPIVVVISFLGYRFIETPFIQKSKNI